MISYSRITYSEAHLDINKIGWRADSINVTENAIKTKL